MAYLQFLLPTFAFCVQVDECESCLQTESHLLGLAQCEATQLRREAANERAQQEALDEHAAALEVACLRAEDEVQRIASCRSAAFGSTFAEAIMTCSAGTHSAIVTGDGSESAGGVTAAKRQ